MPSPNRSPAWQALAAHHQAAEAVHLRDLLKDPERTETLSFELDGLFLDLSKNRITDETLALLLGLASEQGLSTHIAAMAAGEKINSTEGRAALHMALRAEAAALGLGKIDGMRRTGDGRYKISGLFGRVQIDAERPLVRLKDA